MPLTFVSGDPLLTRAQTLAFGHNARGRSELGVVETAIMQQYPAPFATYQRRCKQGKQTAGTFWLWYESQPHLAFLTIRESSVGATRLRFVQSVLLALARDYALHNLQSVALAPLGNSYERPEILPLLDQWLGNIALPIIVYTDYLPNIQADEGL